MFKSIVVANEYLSIYYKVKLLLGIRNGVRTMHLFTSQKLVKNRTVWSNFEIINAGEPHLILVVF